MRGEAGVGAFDDLALLLVAVVAFSLFFGSLGGAFVAREVQAQAARLDATTDAFLMAVLGDARWTFGRGLLDPARLGDIGADELRSLAANHPFELFVRDLTSGERWTFADGPHRGPSRTAATGANLAGPRVDPAVVAVTVWEP